MRKRDREAGGNGRGADNSVGGGKTDYEDLPSEEEFIIPASDAKGNGEKMWFRCSPGMMREMDLVIRSRKFPYKTEGEMVRHALMRLFRWLRTLNVASGDHIPSVLMELEVIHEILKQDTFYASMGSALSHMGKRLELHMGAGNGREARRLLGMINAGIDKIPEGFWKDQFKEDVSRKWGHIMKLGPTAKFVLKEKGEGK
jgi:hypothetical protein